MHIVPACVHVACMWVCVVYACEHVWYMHVSVWCMHVSIHITCMCECCMQVLCAFTCMYYAYSHACIMNTCTHHIWSHACTMHIQMHSAYSLIQKQRKKQENMVATDWHLKSQDFLHFFLVFVPSWTLYIQPIKMDASKEYWWFPGCTLCKCSVQGTG